MISPVIIRRCDSAHWWAWCSPYAAWCSLFLVVAARSADPLWISRRMTAVVALSSLVALALLSTAFLAAVRRREIAPVFWAVYSGAVVMAGLVIAATLIPSSMVPEAHLHKSLREVFERRGAPFATYSFREVTMSYRTNRVGWVDSDEDKGARPIVFVGDSFLESHSSSNLAARIESRINTLGLRKGVVNLSKADTEPSAEYRNRFYEFALRLKPSRIVVFLFAGNDYQFGYVYEPYRHPRVWVTARTLRHATGLGSDALMFLGRRFVGDRPVLSRQDVGDAMPGSSEELADLTYLAVMSYGTEASVSQEFGRKLDALLIGTGDLLARRLGVWPEILRPSAEKRGMPMRPLSVSRIANASIPGNTQVAPQPVSPRCLATDWNGLWPDYQKLFTLPVDARLDAIGAFVAERYCGFTDSKPFTDLLAAQSEDFRNYLTWGPDMPYSLFPAIASGVAGEKLKPWTDPAEAERLGREYAKLVVEMAEAARAQGSAFTVVLIPDAPAVDSAFRRFWSGMPQFWDRFRGNAWAQAALAKELAGRVDVVDLAEHADLLQGGYRPLDGHFNERAHAAVAEFLAQRFASEERTPWKGGIDPVGSSGLRRRLPALAHRAAEVSDERAASTKH